MLARGGRGQPDGLTVLRLIFASYILALGLFVVVLLVLNELQTEVRWVPILVASVSPLSLVGAVWARNRRLLVDTEEN